jgi:hypothetical protein
VSSTSVIQIARGIISYLACSLSPLHCSLFALFSRYGWYHIPYHKIHIVNLLVY